MSSLYELTGEYKELLDLLEDEEIEEQVVLDTLEGVEGEIEIKAENYAKILRTLNAKAENCEAEKKYFATKQKVLEHRIDILKAMLLYAMKETGKTKIETDLFQIKVVKNGGVVPIQVLVEADKLPKEYQKIKIEANTEAIRSVLKENPTVLEGMAKLEERKEHVSIK